MMGCKWGWFQVFRDVVGSLSHSHLSIQLLSVLFSSSFLVQGLFFVVFNGYDDPY